MDKLKLLVAIADKGLGEGLGRALSGCGCHGSLLLAGHGTARKALAEYLGLRDLHKDVLITLTPENRAKDALQAVESAMGERRHFLAFTIPLNSIGKSAYEALAEGEDAHGKPI